MGLLLCTCVPCYRNEGVASQLPPDNVIDTGILGDKKKKNDNAIKDRMKRYRSRNSDAYSDKSSAKM